MSRKSISNREYEEALNNTDNIRIINATCSLFSNVLDPDTLHRCGLIGLWRCLQYDRPATTKFTTALWQYVKWECLRELKAEKEFRKKHKSLAIDIPYEERVERKDSLDAIRHHMDSLPEQHRRVLELRFFEQKTFEEIGTELGFTKQAACLNHQLALEKLQRLCTQN